MCCFTYHSRPKWGVNPNFRVLGQDAYPLKALSMVYSKIEKIGKNVLPQIGRNENFVIQMAFDDEKF